MGLHNRDYARGSSPYDGGGGFVSPGGSVLKKIIIATVAVFVLQLVTTHPVTFGTTSDGISLVGHQDSISNWFAVDFEKITSQGQIWRLLTYAFCHSRTDLLHIVFNLYLLWILGREMESLYGSKEFAWLYGVSAVFAAICYLLIGLLLAAASGRRMGLMLGASGAVTAIAIVYTLHYPRRKIYIWGVFGIEMRWLMAFYLLKDVYPLAGELLGFRAYDPRGSNVAHSAHLGGALFGWMYFKRQLRLSNLINGVGLGAIKKKANQRRTKLRVFAPPDEGHSGMNRPRGGDDAVSGEQVDAILAKISDQGEESLTDREREMLAKASRQYRQK